ncbi:hypothetical protein WJX82_006285 [Trebouxia sp. C0006]
MLSNQQTQPWALEHLTPTRQLMPVPLPQLPLCARSFSLLKQDKVPTVGTKFLVMWRGLSNKQVLDVFNSFPQTVEAAASMGLIDSVKPKIDAVRNITHHTCGQAAAAAQQNSPGEIASGSSASVPGKIDSHQICEDLRSAAEAEHVQAVVLRIDTPGGLALASHEIWDEVMQVKASGKPVIASMGNMAASAGCEIAAAADRIVAQPGTITGSIGVIDGKLNLAPALKQFGIDVETVSVGKNALMESWYTGVTRQQQRWADSILDRFYKDFVDKVAAGRNMRAEEVARVAKGRIWTGRDAYQVGLVDELGGLTKAIALAKQMARLPQDNGAAWLEIVLRVQRHGTSCHKTS